MKSLPVVLLFAFGMSLGQAAELVERQVAKSPEGRMELETKMWIEPMWTSPRIDVVLRAGAKTLLKTTIPPEKDARYVKLAWAPSSQTALVGVNLKAAEDWILIRIKDGKASSTYFDDEKVIGSKLLNALPFREDIKSSAPRAFVPWKTVTWPKLGRCEMTYIFHGLGYEGTASLLIDFSRPSPTCTLNSIVPGVDAELWKQQ